MVCQHESLGVSDRMSRESASLTSLRFRTLWAFRWPADSSRARINAARARSVSQCSVTSEAFPRPPKRRGQDSKATAHRTMFQAVCSHSLAWRRSRVTFVGICRSSDSSAPTDASRDGVIARTARVAGNNLTSDLPHPRMRHTPEVSMGTAGHHKELHEEAFLGCRKMMRRGPN